MKKLRLFAPVFLTLLLPVSVFAGDGIIQVGVTGPTPTRAPVTMTSNSAEAEGIIVAWLTSDDSATEVALSLLQGVLALF